MTESNSLNHSRPAVWSSAVNAYCKNDDGNEFSSVGRKEYRRNERTIAILYNFSNFRESLIYKFYHVLESYMKGLRNTLEFKKIRERFLQEIYFRYNEKNFT